MWKWAIVDCTKQGLTKPSLAKIHKAIDGIMALNKQHMNDGDISLIVTFKKMNFLLHNNLVDTKCRVLTFNQSLSQFHVSTTIREQWMCDIQFRYVKEKCNVLTLDQIKF